MSFQPAVFWSFVFPGLFDCSSSSWLSAQRRSIPYIVVMAKSAGTKSGRAKAAKARMLSSRSSYQGPVFLVTTGEVEEPGGVRSWRDVIRHSGSIVVLAVEDAGVDDLALDNSAKPPRKAEPRI